MNLFEKFIYLLQKEMETPKIYGCFHLLCVFITFFFIIFLYLKKKKNYEKQLKKVLATYGIIALLLELLKQISWAFNYDPITKIITWEYEWYAAPFQLCTTPIYVSLICLFLKKGKMRTSLLSYLSFVTILGSLATVIYPESCFVSDILINIHTMWLHCGSLVVSIYLITNNIVKLNKENFKNSIIVFLVFLLIAFIMNLVVYNSGILNGETFNMFYISPYFISSIPIFNIIQENVPYILFLLIYIISISLGSFIIYIISSLIKNKKVDF